MARSKAMFLWFIVQNQANQTPKPAEVTRLKFVVTGFRGDWKAFVQVFGFNRLYSTDKARIDQTSWNIESFVDPLQRKYILV